uniref:Uncharacterized protein n=1 Tax=Glossina pallidipes TaxID=7398 RepID=A0A1B0A140_GLOPL
MTCTTASSHQLSFRKPLPTTSLQCVTKLRVKNYSIKDIKHYSLTAPVAQYLHAAEAAAHTLTHHHHHHYHHYHHNHHHHHRHRHRHRHSRQYCGGIFARLYIHSGAMTAAARAVLGYIFRQTATENV